MGTSSRSRAAHFTSLARRAPARALGFALACALCGAVAAGCLSYVEERCPGCVVVEDGAPSAPPIRAGARSEVVLVHGAFGFGVEWAPVVQALRENPSVDFAAYAWDGSPLRDFSLPARRLAAVLQAILDDAPRSVVEVEVIAHSAGALIANTAVRALRVPRGRRLRLTAIAAPFELNLSPYHPDDESVTPLGLAIGGAQAAEPPPPRGVEIVEYLTEEPSPTVGHADARRVYLGRSVGHSASVPQVAVPLVRSLGAPAEVRPKSPL